VNAKAEYLSKVCANTRSAPTFRRLSPLRRQNWVGGNVSFDRTSLMPPTLGASNSNSTDAFAIVMLQMCAKRFVMSCCKRATTAVPLRRGLCYGPRRSNQTVRRMREYRGGRDRKERLKVVSFSANAPGKKGSSRGTGAVTFLKSASTLGGLEVSPSFCAALFSAVNAQDISTRERKVRRLRCHQLDQSNTGL
jgi:hypothetical protein